MTFTYATVDVKTELMKLVKEGVSQFGFPVKVIRADPAGQAEIPCIGINRASDDETAQTIADGQGFSYDKETKVYTTLYGTFFQEAMEIRVWHENADERDALYQVVKAILFAGRMDLVAKGIIQVTLSSGRDEQDTSMQFAPIPLYWSAITMSYMNPLNVEFTEIIEPISAIIDEGGVYASCEKER